MLKHAILKVTEAAPAIKHKNKKKRITIFDILTKFSNNQDVINVCILYLQGVIRAADDGANFIEFLEH